MTDIIDDRHHAPEGRKKGMTQLVLIACLMLALCFIAYLLLFNQKLNNASAAGFKDKKVSSQLHTASSAFEMPVFRKADLPKPQPLPEPVVPVVSIPTISLEPLPKPEKIGIADVATAPPLPKTEAIVVTEKPMTDEERRLGGGVAGSKGILALSGAQKTPTPRNVNSITTVERVPASSSYASEYEYKEGQPTLEKPVLSSELTNADLDRLQQLAALYGVSDTPVRSRPYLSSNSRSSTEDVSESVSSPSRSDEAPPEEDQERSNYQPINTPLSTESAGQASGIDLTSTRAVGVEARRIKLDYLLKRGTYIGCVLKTRIVSDQAGFISCSITENIYSADGSNLLLPRGSDVLGEFKPKSISNGKVRLQAVWDAVTTPDGIRVNLGSTSTGRLGAAGIGGRINNHFGKKVGIPILLTLFRTAIDYRTRNFS